MKSYFPNHDINQAMQENIDPKLEDIYRKQASSSSNKDKPNRIDIEFENAMLER